VLGKSGIGKMGRCNNRNVKPSPQETTQYRKKHKTNKPRHAGRVVSFEVSVKQNSIRKSCNQ